MLYGHGDDFYNAKSEVKINFSSNVWHGANLEKLKEHLNEEFDSLTRYPEPDAATLKRLLARRQAADVDCSPLPLQLQLFAFVRLKAE